MGPPGVSLAAGVCSVQAVRRPGRRRSGIFITCETQLGKMLAPVTAVTRACGVLVLLLVPVQAERGKMLPA